MTRLICHIITFSYYHQKLVSMLYYRITSKKYYSYSFPPSTLMWPVNIEIL